MYICANKNVIILPFAVETAVVEHTYFSYVLPTPKKRLH